MSTVSTRDELQGLAHHLESRRCIIADWPGFGDTARPRLNYDRALCRRFLDALVAHLCGELKRRSFPVLACGHAAGYAIDFEARQPGTFTQLVLVAPTWRGPLPTMMSGRKPIQERIRRLIHAPVVGELLYRLNVSRPVVRMMYRRHVFADPAFLTDDLLADRMPLTRQPGARVASACFVTGALDPFDDRAAFLAAAKRVQNPILILYGPDTPPRSRAEMEALASLPGIESKVLAGPAYVYILKGPFTVDEEGKGTQVFETGQVYEEPVGEPMLARNTNAAEPMEMLVVQISDEGEPLMYKAE